MKLLWLARLCRPDIQVAVNALGSHVTCWTRADDRRLARFIGYISVTTNYAILSFMHNQALELRLSCYADASDCNEPAKSCSGFFIALEADQSFLPLVWVSKKQSVASKSTTESEAVALATAVFSECIPLQSAWETVLGRPLTVTCYEDNQAVLAIIKKGYSSKLRHLPKTHKINVASVSELFRDSQFQIEYIATDHQKGDILTKDLGPQKWGPGLEIHMRRL